MMMASLLEEEIISIKTIQTEIRIKELQTILTQDASTTIITTTTTAAIRIQGAQVIQIIQVRPEVIVVLIAIAISI